ncbi:MAG: hypothetical protein F6K41_35365 [Symploca sp. SIO3E6]|nr:hypothetical protein [Caldora sp. SIO3E6]
MRKSAQSPCLNQRLGYGQRPPQASTRENLIAARLPSHQPHRKLHRLLWGW